MTDSTDLRFIPHPLLKGGHRQTLAGYYAPQKKYRYSATRHTVELPDGDELMLHDDCPPGWGPGSPFVMLMHGLAGCHGSGYMMRIASKLARCGVRTFRLDHRGSGAAARKAKLPYHAGRSDDVRFAFDRAAGLCGGSLGAIVGFSLSGNMLLKMLGENGRRDYSPTYLASAIAVNPPIDLELCSQGMQQGFNRVYDRHFTKLLRTQVQERIDTFADAPRPTGSLNPESLRQFDDEYTAPASGFDGVEDYYFQSSAAQFIDSIQIPTMILTARDDPLIPVSSFEQLPQLPAVTLQIEEHGGHLGYLSSNRTDGDCRWMDARVISWLAEPLRFAIRR